MKKRTHRTTIVALQAILLLVMFFPVGLLSQGSAGGGLLNVFGMVQWYAGTPFYIIAFMSTLIATILPLAVIFAAFRSEEDQVYTIGMLCSGLYTALNIVFFFLAKAHWTTASSVASFLLIAAGIASFVLCLVWRKAELFDSEEVSFQKQAI